LISKIGQVIRIFSKSAKKGLLGPSSLSAQGDPTGTMPEWQYLKFNLFCYRLSLARDFSEGLLSMSEEGIALQKKPPFHYNGGSDSLAETHRRGHLVKVVKRFRQKKSCRG
jgi:hypothetical protein